MVGTNGTIFALGDCTATSYAPTAQVASQQGAYLGRIFAQIAKRDSIEARLQALQHESETPEIKAEIESNQKQLSKVLKLRPFHYSHQGSLAYVHPFLLLPYF